jgi:ribosomal protein S18 acetylase RimI-like enzyme
VTTSVVARIRPGEPADTDALLALFDEAVRWLVARDQPGQWGTEPWSSRPQAVTRVRQWANGPGLRIAEAQDGTVLGALVLLPDRPPHVAAIAEPERYVDALVTSRAHAGLGVGAELIAAAVEETRAAGVPVLRVDCWADAPPLIAWYERQGFVRSGGFDVDGWRGQVFEMRV